MGVILRMDSEKFISEFLKEFDPNKFNFILVSENITSEQRYKNVMVMRKLMLPPDIAAMYINDGFGKSYQKKYLEYLKKDDVNGLVAIIVKAALNGLNIVLLCSKSENEFKYLKMLCEFIEEEYKLKTYSYKKFKKDPQKALKIKNRDEVVEVLMKKLEKLHDSGVDLNPDVNKDKFLKKLGKLEKKELIKFCKVKGIKIDEDMGRKEIIKKIKKKLFKKSKE